jgi:hypothetical protein
MSAARRWPWALAFVLCLHLLTLPLTWIVTDQSEMILMARQLLANGTFTLAPDGKAPVPEAPWIPHHAGEPVRSRLFPGTSLVLVPLLALDELLGLQQPPHFGRIVHLQGFLCVALTLGLLGAAAARLGAGAAGIALAVAVVGTSWPVWLISRHGGAEPVVGLLLAVFVAARSTAARGLALACLPWTHPSGFVLAPLLAAAAWLDAADRPRGLFFLAAAGLSCASVLLFWNRLYHGHWLTGGYAQVGGDRFFGATSVANGLSIMALDCARELPVLLLLAGLCARATRAGGRRWWWPALVVLATLLLLFATYYEHDTTRRIAVAWPLFVIPIALAWPALGWNATAARLLVLASTASGVYWFLAVAGSYYQSAGGFLPGAVWSEAYIRDGWSVAWMAPLLALLLALARSGRRCFELLG